MVIPFPHSLNPTLPGPDCVSASVAFQGETGSRQSQQSDLGFTDTRMYSERIQSSLDFQDRHRHVIVLLGGSLDNGELQIIQAWGPREVPSPPRERTQAPRSKKGRSWPARAKVNRRLRPSTML